MICLMGIISVVCMAQKPFTLVVNAADGDTSTVRVYLPNKGVSIGRAVVICPGGGYSHLAMDHEGYRWADFYNRLGIAAIVLKYRMPHGNRELPISDAEGAIRLVRENSEKWGINKEDVGIQGSSAGGHLATTIATHSQGDAKPDFQILFYPVVSMDPKVTHMGSHNNFLGKNPDVALEKEYSNALKVNETTPKAFIVLASDDKAVIPQNSLEYYQALCNYKINSALHVFPKGGHGFGHRETFLYHSQLLIELATWLRSW